jgi:hypothetical protein
MKRLGSSLAAALLVGALAAPARADEIQWASSYDDALKQAAAGSKLVMADFFTDW